MLTLDALHIDYELSVLESLRKMEKWSNVVRFGLIQPTIHMLWWLLCGTARSDGGTSWGLGRRVWCHGDKDVKDMAALISELSLPVYLIEPVYPRRMPLAELVKFFDSAAILGQGSVTQFAFTSGKTALFCRG